jgi:hypothetical protein
MAKDFHEKELSKELSKEGWSLKQKIRLLLLLGAISCGFLLNSDAAAAAAVWPKSFI